MHMLRRTPIFGIEVWKRTRSLTHQPTSTAAALKHSQTNISVLFRPISDFGKQQSRWAPTRCDLNVLPQRGTRTSAQLACRRVYLLIPFLSAVMIVRGVRNGQQTCLCRCAVRSRAMAQEAERFNALLAAYQVLGVPEQ